MMKSRSSHIRFSASLPSLSILKANLKASEHSCVVLIHDRVLSRTPGFGRFARQFDGVFAVQSGESLKSLRGLERFLTPRFWRTIAGFGRGEIILVAAGGGSVGDFAGFLASVLKRGVRLVHMPTTWLAAVDSAHGGKTALNVGRTKNQLGSFYPAEQILVVQSLLRRQSKGLELSAWGEILKIAFISGGSFWRKVSTSSRFGARELWMLLPEAIRAKQRIVRADPFETKGRRLLLNLGHTFGHALELTRGMPHGLAVAHGMAFAMAWSHDRGQVSAAQIAEFESLWKKAFGQKPVEARRSLKIRRSVLKRLLSQDKKATKGNDIRFVFPHRPGRVLVQKVSVDEILSEAGRQQWLR